MLGFRPCLMGSLRLLYGVEPVQCGRARLPDHAHPIFSHSEPRRLVRRIPGIRAIRSHSSAFARYWSDLLITAEGIAWGSGSRITLTFHTNVNEHSSP